jgi:hypothetical protein
MKILFFVFSLIIYISCDAQLGKTKEEIINDLGTDYHEGVDKSQNFYIYYYSDRTSDASGNFSSTAIFYFRFLKCYAMCVIEPKTEARNWANIFDRLYVKKSEYGWLTQDGRILNAVIFNEDNRNISVITSYND